jgi:predicted PurR-regulated permease PerM
MESVIALLLVTVVVLFLVVVVMMFTKWELTQSLEHYKELYRDYYDQVGALKLDVEQLQSALQQAKQDELETLFRAVQERDHESDVESEIEQHFKFVQGVGKLRVMLTEGDDDE